MQGRRSGFSSALAPFRTLGPWSDYRDRDGCCSRLEARSATLATGVYGLARIGGQSLEKLECDEKCPARCFALQRRLQIGRFRRVGVRQVILDARDVGEGLNLRVIR